MTSAVKSYLFDDRRLRNRALTEFARATRSGRLIAFTGAYTTKDLGYGSWADLSFEVAERVAIQLQDEDPRSADHGQIKPILARLKLHVDELKKLSPRVDEVKNAAIGKPEVKKRDVESPMADARVHFALIRAGLAALDEMCPFPPGRTGSRLGRFDADLAGMFVGRQGPTTKVATSSALAGAAPAASKVADDTAEATLITTLVEQLGIYRFVTLNYDFEIERTLMLYPHERLELGSGGKFQTYVEIDDHSGPVERNGHGRLRRVLGDGTVCESDLVDRERPDRLFEFAIRYDAVDRHILHLHGRADDPRSMIFDIRDYDARYRRDDVFRNPFEHGLRVLFAGNPILFYGVGMKEAEVNQTLQAFVSDNPNRRTAPAFLVWNTDHWSEEERIDRMALFRVDLYQRLGVHVIFDQDVLPVGAERDPAAASDGVEPAGDGTGAPGDATGLAGDDGAPTSDEAVPMKGGAESPNDQTVLVNDGRAPPNDQVAPAKDRAAAGNSVEALARTVERLAAVVAKLNKLGQVPCQSFRSVAERMEPRGGPVRLWGTPELIAWAGKQSVAMSAVGTATPAATLAVRYQTDPIDEPFTDPERPPRLVVATSDNGFGRGVLAEWLLVHAAEPTGPLPLAATEERDRLLVNAGFSYDSDAMLAAIYQFLRARGGASAETTLPCGFGSEERCEGGASEGCRERSFVTGTAFATDRHALVIVNGIDRFFDADGAPLSAELDLLLRCVRQREDGNVQWLLLGTERVRRYFATLGVDVWNLVGTGEPPAGAFEERKPLRSLYYAAVSTAGLPPSVADQARLEQALETSGDQRAFFSAYLNLERLARPRTVDGREETPTDGALRAALMFEVLRAMAFIGWPIEAAVLRHVPKLRTMLAGPDGAGAPPPSAKRDEQLVRTLEALRTGKFIVEILPFDCHRDDGGKPAADTGFTEGGPDQSSRLRQDAGSRAERWKGSPAHYLQNVRYGLHRSLATDLRQRFGIPLSEAKLASAFNMSLFAAQPSDDYKPEPHFHDELGQLVDRLLGAWHDEDTVGLDLGGMSVDAAREVLLDPSDPLAGATGSEQDELSTLARLASREGASCLRAALAVIRGYYSTGSLLSLDRTDTLVDPGRDGALTEHADRLDRLLRMVRRVTQARAALRERMGVDDAALASVRAAMGPEPLYADDLVWLHNERGVVKLAQGDVYAASRSFYLALGANRSHVEHGYRGHNWRRITLNLVGVLIERGRLNAAEARLDEIARSIDDAAWMTVRPTGTVAAGGERSADTRAADGPEVAPGRLAQMLARFGSAGVPSSILCGEYARDELLVAGLVAGYRGVIAMHRGQERNAYEHLLRGLRVLRRLGEQRGYALFQRHYASLRRFADADTDREREIHVATESADASGQADLSHRARILQADFIRRNEQATPAARRDALNMLRRALDYAALTDSHRVRIEAQASLGRLMLESGDYEAALKHSADAMAVACRYGHSLQKLSLRVQIGDILIRRGDPKSGQAMLERALNGATRIGYQRIVERVQRARKHEVLSAASTTINV